MREFAFGDDEASAGRPILCRIATDLADAPADWVAEPNDAVIDAIPSLEMAVTIAPVFDVQFRRNCELSDEMIVVGMAWESSETLCQLPSAATLLKP